MKLRFFPLWILCILLSSLTGQIEMNAQDLPGENKSISVTSRLAVVDKLKRLYVVAKDNSVQVYGDQGQVLYQYSNRRIGAISHIDVSNPIKILLFCKDFGRIVILDNTLSEVQEFVLSDIGFSEVSAVATTNDNGYWIYDPLRFRLIKLNAEGNIVLSSSNLSDYGIYAPKIQNIRESGNRVLLYDENFGFLLFDNYAQYIKKFPIEGIRSFHFDGKKVTFFDGKNVYSLDLEINEQQLVYKVSEKNIEVVTDVILSEEEIVEIHEGGIIRLHNPR